VTDLLKDHADISHCEENKLLVGEKFEEVLHKSSKTKKKASEIFTGLNRKRKSPASSSGHTRPFRSGPLPASRGTRGSGSGRGHFSTKFAKIINLQSFHQSKTSNSFTFYFPKIHPLVQKLFAIKKFPQILSRAGRIKFFLKNWQCLTQDPHVISMVQGYRIPFKSPPEQ